MTKRTFSTKKISRTKPWRMKLMKIRTTPAMTQTNIMKTGKKRCQTKMEMSSYQASANPKNLPKGATKCNRIATW